MNYLHRHIDEKLVNAQANNEISTYISRELISNAELNLKKSDLNTNFSENCLNIEN